MLSRRAAAVGLALVGVGLRAGFYIIGTELLEGGRLPFWFRPTLSPITVAYTGLLTAVAAAVIGLLPALKATDGLRARLQKASAGGGGGAGFGGIWTVAIVAQIAVTCIAPIFTIAVWSESRGEYERVELDIPTDDYIGARLDLDRERGPGIDEELAQARYRERYRDVLTRIELGLAADPRVGGVAFSQRLPRQYHPWNQIAERARPASGSGDRRSGFLPRARHRDPRGARLRLGRSGGGGAQRHRQ